MPKQQRGALQCTLDKFEKYEAFYLNGFDPKYNDLDPGVAFIKNGSYVKSTHSAWLFEPIWANMGLNMYIWDYLGISGPIWA